MISGSSKIKWWWLRLTFFFHLQKILNKAATASYRTHQKRISPRPTFPVDNLARWRVKFHAVHRSLHQPTDRFPGIHYRNSIFMIRIRFSGYQAYIKQADSQPNIVDPKRKKFGIDNTARIRYLDGYWLRIIPLRENQHDLFRIKPPRSVKIWGLSIFSALQTTQVLCVRLWKNRNKKDQHGLTLKNQSRVLKVLNRLNLWRNFINFQMEIKIFSTPVLIAVLPL